MDLSRDDLDLTLKQLKSQRVELTISVLLNEAAIMELERRIAKLPKKPKPKKIIPTGVG